MDLTNQTPENKPKFYLKPAFIITAGIVLVIAIVLIVIYAVKGSGNNNDGGDNTDQTSSVSVESTTTSKEETTSKTTSYTTKAATTTTTSATTVTTAETTVTTVTTSTAAATVTTTVTAAPATVPATTAPTTTAPPKPVTTAATTAAPAVTTAAASAIGFDQYASEVVRLVNAERAKVGLGALEMNQTLNQMAATRAVETVTLFSHTRPDGTSCFSVFDQYGVAWSAVGENIACGQPTPAEVMNSWMNSDGHRANILSADFASIGVGVYESGGYIYWVQIFATLR